MKRNILWNAMLTMVMIFSMNIATMAQTSFKECFKTMMERNLINNNFKSEDLKEAYIQILMAGGTDQASAQNLAEEYIQQQFKNDMIDCVMPYYQSVMTIDDVQQILTLTHTTTGKTALQNIGKVNELMNTPEVQNYMQSAVMQMIQGQDPTPLAAQTPASYQNKFNQYWECNHMDEMMSNIVESIGAGMANVMGNQEQQKVFENFMTKFGKFMKTNMKTLLTNESSQQVTEADLDFYVKTFSTPVGQKFIQGNLNLSKNTMKVGENIVQKFQLWAQKKINQ